MIDEASRPQQAAGNAPPSPEAVAAPAPSPADRARRGHWLVLGLQIAVAVLIVAGMYGLNFTAGKLVMPRPDAVLAQSVKLWSDGSMLRALGQSLTVLTLGYLLAVLSGVGLGILLGGFRIVGRIFDPFVAAMNATPGAAFIPLIIVWFGLYTEGKVVLVWHGALFPILINTAAGIANANKDLVEMGRAFGARRLALFWNVMVPDAVPPILRPLRICAAVATVGTVIAELTMAQSGLGGLLATAGNRFQMDKYFAVVIVLMVLGTLITAALRYAERRVGRWRAS